MVILSVNWKMKLKTKKKGFIMGLFSKRKEYVTLDRFSNYVENINGRISATETILREEIAVLRSCVSLPELRTISRYSGWSSCNSAVEAYMERERTKARNDGFEFRHVTTCGTETWAKKA